MGCASCTTQDLDKTALNLKPDPREDLESRTLNLEPYTTRWYSEADHVQIPHIVPSTRLSVLLLIAVNIEQRFEHFSFIVKLILYLRDEKRADPRQILVVWGEQASILLARLSAPTVTRNWPFEVVFKKRPSKPALLVRSRSAITLLASNRERL